jgi:hypothetical protein
MDKTLKEATRDGSAAALLSSADTATSFRGLMMESKLQATRFNQKFALAKFCVEQDIEGGKEMIQAMMDEMRKESPASTHITKKTGNKNVVPVVLFSHSSSDEADDACESIA